VSSGNLVIDPTFIAPQDWCNGAASWPSTFTLATGLGASVSTESEQIFLTAYGTIGLSFNPPTGSEIVVGAGQIKVGDTLAFSAYVGPWSRLIEGSPYFGLLDHNGALLASAGPDNVGVAAGTYTVAAGVVSIRPVFYLVSVSLPTANPGRSAWAASHAYAVNAQVDPGNGYLYQCIVAGTSGGTQPTWPTPTGWVPSTGDSIPLTVVTDGGVTWSCVAWQGDTIMLGNPYIAVL
jgi:hypothetical protein